MGFGHEKLDEYRAALEYVDTGIDSDSDGNQERTGRQPPPGGGARRRASGTRLTRKKVPDTDDFLKKPKIPATAGQAGRANPVSRGVSRQGGTDSGVFTKSSTLRPA